MKKCLKCGQTSGIKDKHKFCHNCGGNVFEVTEKRVVVGDGSPRLNASKIGEHISKLRFDFEDS